MSKREPEIKGAEESYSFETTSQQQRLLDFATVLRRVSGDPFDHLKDVS